MRKGSLRWAFRFGAWSPTEEEWSLAARCVQPEEKQRIARFMFKRDAKSAMAGRLLLRKAVSETCDIPYKDVLFDRSEKQKPFLKTEVSARWKNLSFNVSHQGQFAVLAADPEWPVGIDVMQVEQPSGVERVVKFFHTMRRQFTPGEWDEIKSPDSELDQLATFYRFWCLKESYVKALGVGVGFSLQRIDFRTPFKTVDMRPGITVTDSKVFIDGVEEEDWTFEETKLDEEHFVAVALNVNRHAQGDVTVSSDSGSTRPPGLFTELTFAELTSCAVPQRDPDPAYWETFRAKQEKPAGKR